MPAHRIAASVLCLVAGLAAVLAAPAASAVELPRIVVLPAQGAPLSEVDRAALDARLRAAVAKDPGHVLVDVPGTVRFIENAAALGMMCAGDDVDCWAKAGVTGGAAHLLLPIVVVDSAGARTLDLTLVDATRGDAVRGPSMQLPSSGGALDEQQVQKALRAVLAPRPMTGGLRVAGRVAGARVIVDGQDRGTTPLVAPLVADEGRHTVQLVAPGLVAEPVVVEVAPGMEADVEVDVRAAPPPVAQPPQPTVDPRLAGGVSALASGGLLAVAAGAGIAASETAFCCTNADTGARNMWRGATATLLAVGAVSSAVALAGGGAVAWSMMGGDDAQ